MATTPFGQLADGTEITHFTLTGGGLTVGVLNYGAVIRSLDFSTAKGAQPCVLGLETLADYLAHSPSMGIVAGRYANRIGGGRFQIDGHDYQLSLNERDKTHLHGGIKGFGKRPWTVLDHGTSHVALQIVSPDGDEGYPGRVEATCTYAITGEGVLTITLTATTDAPTVVNLATHSYFNLDGSDSALDHTIEIPADHYTPVDDDQIPTGEIAPVAGTPFDFRIARPLRMYQDGDRVSYNYGYLTSGVRVGYDHNFVVAAAKSTTPHRMATVVSPLSGIELQIHSTELGVQLYDGGGMKVPVPGLGGRPLGATAGLCLEPQFFPDTPNKPQFGDCTLRPGETYRQITEYRLRQL